MQTKRESFIETLISIAIGFVVAMLSQMAIFPLFGIHITVAENFIMSVYFTIISIIRGYYVRRWFNARLLRKKNVTPV